MKIRSSLALTRIAGVASVTCRGTSRRIAGTRGPLAAATALLVGASMASLSAGSVASASARPASALKPAALSPAALRAAPTVAVGSRPLVPAADRAAGAVAGTATETGAIVVRPRDEQALTSFISGVTDRGSVMYHKYLARGQFRSRFGPAAATTALVEESLRAEGLHVAGVSADGLLVSFRGSAASVERAFRTGLERYRLPDGTMGQATTGAPHVPLHRQVCGGRRRPRRAGAGAAAVRDPARLGHVARLPGG